MRRASSLLLCLAIVFAVGSCGDGDASSRSAAAAESSAGKTTAVETEEERLAELVTELWTDIEEGDSAAACAAMSERGRRFFVRAGARSAGVRADLSCAETVDALSVAMAATGGDAARRLGPFTAADAWVDGDEAQVGCRYRGAVMLERVDGEWLVRVPFCFD